MEYYEVNPNDDLNKYNDIVFDINRLEKQIVRVKNEITSKKKVLKQYIDEIDRLTDYKNELFKKIIN